MVIRGGHERTGWRKVLTLAFFAAVVLTNSSCANPAGGIDYASHRKEIEQWREKRAAELTSDDSWLTLVGLFWLKDGENKFGSDASNGIVLPQGKAPRFAGSVWREPGGNVRLQPHPEGEITHNSERVASALALQSDANSERPTVFNIGTLSFNLIKRGQEIGLRVKDRDNPARANFAGLQHYPIDAAWRIEARFESYSPPKSIQIVNVLGMVEDQTSPGAIVFEVEGKTHRLDALAEEGSRELFIIVADGTSGKETYGAGRYLYTDAPDAEGKIVIDFNKAHNPPCAFTDYATCPLPPRQNRLSFRVTAGEMAYKH